MLKHNSKSGSDNILEHKKLIDLCIGKIKKDVCVVCEVPPLKKVEQYRDKNKIDEINNLIKLHYSDKPSFKILFLNANIENVKKILWAKILIPMDIILYFDNVHLNCQHGVPLLKNWLLSHLRLTSNGSIIPKGLYQNNKLTNTAPSYKYSFRSKTI